MAKDTTTTTTTPSASAPGQTTTPSASAPGTVETRTLTAKTRGELVQLLEELKATVAAESPSGCVFITGPVARSKEDGSYTIQVDIIYN